MKKCASCTKDLPEAALHCVFCGAKQPPAPAVQPGLAKTAFGYSNEMMEQLKQSAPPAAPYSPQRAQPPSQPPPRAHVPSQPPPQYAPPRPHPPSQPPNNFGVSPAAANAATVFVQGPPPPIAPQQQPYAPQSLPQPYNMPTAAMPPGAGYQPGPQTGGMGVHAPQQYTPQPLATVPQPYYGAGPQARGGGRPLEPWRYALPFMMIVWGVVMLVAFATPTTSDPLGWNWDAILNGDGKHKVGPLVIASIGLLGVVFGAIPLGSLPRGIAATVLGLGGIFVPLILEKNMFDDLGASWRDLIVIVGALTLIPGLLLRQEYTESLLSRMLVTIGVVCVLVPIVVPNNGEIPLIHTFKALIDNSGEHKVGPILQLGGIALTVIALLVWMPGPATGGAKVIAWLLILYPVVTYFVEMILAGHVVDVVKKQPILVDAWAFGVVCIVFVGYGLATVLGKQLE